MTQANTKSATKTPLEKTAKKPATKKTAKKPATTKATKKPATKKTAKKTATTKATKKAATKKTAAETATPRAAKKAFKKGASGVSPSRAANRHLVIVESPTKAKTINKYLGDGFLVMASVGHVRDLPSRAPKGVKQEVPGVDLEANFQPTYEIVPAKRKTVSDLRKAAKLASDVWFATDLDREGEAIAWHLAQALGVPTETAKRVVFNAITKQTISEAFEQPRAIDEQKVNAQQARRILDRIVGYQVSPLLWKKVAGGLSAGRVQSVATRLVVEREREIEAFVPDEYWKVTGYFTQALGKVASLAAEWESWLIAADPGSPRTIKDRVLWLNDHRAFKAELVQIDGKPFKPTESAQALEAVRRLGLIEERVDSTEDPKSKGPARTRKVVRGHLDPRLLRDTDPGAFVVKSLQTKRTTSRPAPPFITSSLQQAGANQLGFPLRRTMRVAQQLYEGIDIHGREGQIGLITYMRTDSVFVAGEALAAARAFIGSEFGKDYLPEKPNFYSTRVKSAQEAHEAIRPTDVRIVPERVKSSLTDEQYKLYRLIWNRFVASQMLPAEWDATTALISAYGVDAATPRREVGVFKATGRLLRFDGFYKVTGIPQNGDDPILPSLEENEPLGAIQIDPTQHFTAPPARFTEASLQKKLEEEGIGRPSTYAPIISTIQDRKYVEQLSPKDRRLRATDLGKVVTDKLVEGFPKIMDVTYTRYMEAELDKIEGEHHDWQTMLQEFYGPFRENLDRAHESMTHAKAEMEAAPHLCGKCGGSTVYRFGRSGRFLSCAAYPDCDYGAPIDSEGNPMEPEQTDVACPNCGSVMTRRAGRFGKFLGCINYPDCKGILNLDAKTGMIKLPKVPPLLTKLPCSKCEKPLNMRDSKRGYWLSCSRFPKCRGRLSWSAVPEEIQKELTAAWDAHVEANPLPVVRTLQGDPVGEEHIPTVLGEESEIEDAPLPVG